MSRLGTAFRSFFAALGDADKAGRIAAAINDEAARIEPPTEPVEPPQPTAPNRSDAVTLLAAFQRDGRLLDFLMEPIDEFSDDQIGAAVRDVHRGCRQTIERLLPVGPAVDAEEGTTIATASYPDGSVRVVGSQAASGTLLHPGWKAADVKLPDYTGSADEAAIIMPAEVQGG